jgi:hypothetical protein
VLAALLCVVIASVVLVRGLAPTPSVAPLAQRMESPPDLERMQSLFGSASASGAPTAEPQTATDPNFRLIGVIVDGGRSLALISINGERPKPVAIGARFNVDARLVAIDADRVTIERVDGRTSVLQIPPKTAAGTGPAAAAGAAPAAQGASSPTRR